MISLSAIRRTQTRWARHVLGMFVVVWLNFALQPCAMAMGGDADHDCPHCPPAHSEEHDGHDMGDMAGHDAPCATGDGECGMLDDLNYDGRVAKLEVEDAPDDTTEKISAPPSDLWPIVRPVHLVGLQPARSPPSGVPPSLNKLYCVYLN